jgi:hypothetical protein
MIPFCVFLSPGEHKALPTVLTALHGASFATCCAVPLHDNDDAAAWRHDCAALDAADAAVLMLPSDRYARILLSFAAMDGKPTIVLAGENFRTGRSTRLDTLEFVSDVAGLVSALARWRDVLSPNTAAITTPTLMH